MQNLSKLKLFALITLSTALSLVTSLTAFAAATTPAVSTATYKTGVAKIMVVFNVPVWGDSGLTTTLGTSDFQLAGTCGFTGAATISSVNHTAGNTWALLTIGGVAGADETSCTVAAKANSVFTVGGAVSEKTTLLTSDTAAPVVSGPGGGIGKMFSGNNYVLITFNEPIFGNSSASTAVAGSAFTLTNNNAAGCDSFINGQEVTSVGADFIIEKCTTSAVAGDNTVDSFDYTDNTSLYDALGNAATTGTTKLLASVAFDLTFSKIHTGDAAIDADTCVGCTNGLTKLNFPAFNVTTPSMSAYLASSDFSYSDTGGGGKTLSSVGQVPNMQWVKFTMSSAFVAADLTTGTIDTLSRADAFSIYDPWGRTIDTTVLSMVDNTAPVILSLTKSLTGNVNTIAIQYSEKIKISTWDSISESAPSTTTVGDLTSAGIITGLGSFATTGDVTVPTAANTVALNGDQTAITVSLANTSTSAYLNTGSATEPSSTFTPQAAATYITDLEPNTGNGIVGTSIQSTITSSSGWDLIKPTLSSITVSEGTGLVNGKIDKAVLVFNSNMRDVSFTAGNGSLASGAGTFSTGDADDNTTTFNRTADTATTGTAASDGDFTYSAATTKITDLAGNLLNLATDGQIASGEVTEIDGAAPVLLTAQWSIQNENNLTLEYSEALTVYSNGGITQITAGTSATSTTTLGDMTTAKQIPGILTWSNGSMDYKNNATGANEVALNGAGTIITLTFNSTSGSFFSVGTTAPDGTETISVVSDTNDIKDAANLGAVAPTAGVSASVRTPWDATPPSQITGFNYSNSGDTGTRVTWTAHGPLADFSRYMIAYGTSAGVNLSSSLWTSIVDTNLVSIATSSSLITGLSRERTYYAKIYAIDLVGNVSPASSETSWYVLGTTSQETTTTTTTTTTRETTTTERTTTPTTETTTTTVPPIPPTTITTTRDTTVVVTDIPADQPQKDFIEAMIRAGIFKGNEDGTFQPDVSIKRSEVATVFYRILGLPEPPETPIVAPYSDVPRDSWEAGYVQEMKDMKFLSDRMSTFGPDTYATKAEFLRFAMNIYKLLATESERATIKTLEENTATMAFGDVSADSWYAGDIAAASAKGFIGGTECRKGTCFFASGTITRANVAEILYNMFGEMLGVK